MSPKPNNEWKEKFKFLMDDLFVPPHHAGNPPIVGWTHWHSKESYEYIFNKVSDFIYQLLSSERRRVKQIVIEDVLHQYQDRLLKLLEDK